MSRRSKLEFLCLELVDLEPVEYGEVVVVFAWEVGKREFEAWTASGAWLAVDESQRSGIEED